MKTAKIVLGVVLLLFVLLLYYTRTWFQGVVLFFYATPAIWQMLGVTLLIHYGLLRHLRSLRKPMSMEVEGKRYESVSPAFLISLSLFFVLAILGGLLANMARGVHIAETVPYSFRHTLPESSTDVRLMPYHVAKRYAKDSLQLSQYRLGTENIAVIDNRLQWVFPLTPDGLVITFLRKNKGIVTVDATTQAKNAQHTWGDMAIGEGMQIRDNLFWNIYRQQYFITTDDPFYLPTEDDIYTVLGAIGYRFRFRWGLLYTVPFFKGVFVVNTAGDIEFVPAEETQSHPVLAGNRVFPESLTRTYVDAYQFHRGAINKLFIHEDQIQIQDVRSPGSPVNRQPYLMNTREGLKWFISTEPYGASHGIFKIFVVDAATGRIEVFELPEDQTLTGPVRAVDYVRRSNPVVDWSRFDSVEPLPFIRNQDLYWKLTVIPDDAAGIAYQAFVNARTNDVVELRTADEISGFLQGHLDIDDLSSEAETDLLETIRSLLKEVESLLDQLEENR